MRTLLLLLVAACGLPGFQSTVLSGGLVVVRFDVTEAGYYIGKVTATFERRARAATTEPW